MAKKSDTLNREQEQSQPDQNPEGEDALRALCRLRNIGEKLPTVDAAKVIRESRELAGHGSVNDRR